MQRPGKFLITRQVEFSAAHRLYLEQHSPEENETMFGPCANPYGHGHNYVLECTLEGEQDPRTQMVVHFAELKRILSEVVVKPLDHRHLNLDVPFLSGVLPTSENLLQVLWTRLSTELDGRPWRLRRLKLSSTARNWVEYSGPEGEIHG